MRQTNYSNEECETKLLEWKNNYLHVIKEYINPDFYKTKPKICTFQEFAIWSTICTFVYTMVDHEAKTPRPVHSQRGK